MTIRRAARGVAAALLAAVLGPAAQPVESRMVSVTELKAAVVSSFAPFIEWPDGAFPANAPMALCVVNDVGVAQALERNIAGRSVGSHKLTVTAISGDAPLPPCHVIYIAGPETKRALQMASSTMAFTIGDAADFVATGGMVKLFRHDDRLHFEVNLDPIQRAGMKLSSRVLVLADVVRDAHGVVKMSDR